MHARTRSVSLISLLALAGCGAETAGTAAVGAQTQVEAARQAQETKAQVLNQLDAAAQMEKQRLEQAGSATPP